MRQPPTIMWVAVAFCCLWLPYLYFCFFISIFFTFCFSSSGCPSSWGWAAASGSRLRAPLTCSRAGGRELGLGVFPPPLRLLRPCCFHSGGRGAIERWRFCPWRDASFLLSLFLSALLLLFYALNKLRFFISIFFNTSLVAVVVFT